MKRSLPLLFSIVLFISGCASPAGSTSAPTAQAGSTATSPTVEIEPATATFTPEPTVTSAPPSPHWYWAVDADTTKVIAVNQFGDRHELGDLDQADDLFTSSISIDDERAFLFLYTDNNLRVYLLTADGMQKITLPSNPYYFNSEFSQASLAVIAVHDDKAVFSYITQAGSNVMPDTGPIFLVDLGSLTAKLIDKTVSRDPYSNNRHWFHASEEGRYLRYLNGDSEKMDIRELDLISGDVRTIYTTSGSSFGIHTSPEGDLWYLRNSDIILDLNGNQTDFTDKSLVFRPLEDGKGLVLPRECANDCEIKVITPFGNAAELTYILPWGTTQFTGFFDDINQLLPDQSLLFVGQRYSAFKTPPAALQEYPDLKADDSPLFRLTPDGQAQFVGIYKDDFSIDRGYIFLKSLDRTSFFVYDAIADRSLFSMPAIPDLDYFSTSARYFDAGILVHLAGAAPSAGEKIYRDFYHVYSYETSTALAWEDVNLEYNGCPDLLEDRSVICWLYRTDTSNSDLVRYDPASGTKTTLMENVWLIEFIP